MEISVLGIDLGKTSCSIVGCDGAVGVVLRRRVRRENLVDVVAKLAPGVVAMEACCRAHHLGRVFGGAGIKVRLVSPEYVRPYVKAQKNDDRDAEAIAEAATRPTMRFVPVKSEGQSDVQALHRARERLVSDRTALTTICARCCWSAGSLRRRGGGSSRTTSLSSPTRKVARCHRASVC